MVDKRESYTKEDLLASGRGELFGAKGPQLPAPNMLMMDRVVKMTETGGNFDKGYVEAELDINPDLWFFGCHFIGDPVMPGCRAGCDVAAGWLLPGWLGGEGKGRALGVGEVKFTGQVLPTAKKVTYRIHFKRIVNRRLIMGPADGEVLVDGRLIYTANDLKVGLFQIHLLSKRCYTRLQAKPPHCGGFCFKETLSGYECPVADGFSPASQPL